MFSFRMPSALAVFTLCAAAMQTAIGRQDDDEPTLVSVTNGSGKSVICELLEETDTEIRIVRLINGKEFTVRKAHLAGIRKGLSDDEAIASIGLAGFAAWKATRATRRSSRQERIVVLPLLDGHGTETASNRKLAEELTMRLARRGRSVVERERVARLLGERRVDSLSDSTFARKIGEQVGASTVLSGTIARKRSRQEARLRLVRVETGETLFTISHVMHTGDETSVLPPPGPAVVANDYTILERALDVAFSPDGRLLATAGHDATVKLWDTSTGKHRHTFRAHQSRVQDVVFSPDGIMIAAADLDGMVTVWNVASRAEHASVRAHANNVRAIALGPDSRTLATGGDEKTIKLWNISDMRERAVFSGHTDYVRSIAFSRTSGLLASSGNDRTIKLWDLESQDIRATLKGHAGFVYCVAFAPDERLLASASSDGTARLWDLSRRFTIATLRPRAGATNWVAFSPNARLLATCHANETIKLWSTRTYEQLASLGGFTGSARRLAFSPDGRMLAAACGDKKVRVKNVRAMMNGRNPSADAREP